MLRFAVPLAQGALASCAGSGAPPVAAEHRPAGTAESAAFLSQLTNTSNGLEVREWVLADHPERIAAVVMRHAQLPAADESRFAGLHRNGLRFVPVPLDQIETLRKDLGGSSLTATVWHGQVLAWRELEARLVPAGGLALAFDGRVRRVPPGTIRLLVRSWLVPMEDGPRLSLEVVPHFHSPTGEDWQRLLGRTSERPVGEWFTGMAIDTLLEPGMAYLLTTGTAAEGWGGAPDDVLDQHGSAAASTRAGPPDGPGPEAEPPLTVGECLLRSGGVPPRRTMLILIPRIPPDLLSLHEVVAEDSPRAFEPERAANP